jgi:hypothetical protein
MRHIEGGGTVMHKTRMQCFRTDTLMKLKSPKFFLNAQAIIASPDAHTKLVNGGFVKREGERHTVFGIPYGVNKNVNKDLVEVTLRVPDK